MAKYKVRDGFHVHDVDVEPIGPGAIIELTDEQAAAHAHQIEAVEEAKPVKGKARAD